MPKTRRRRPNRHPHPILLGLLAFSSLALASLLALRIARQHPSPLRLSQATAHTVDTALTRAGFPPASATSSLEQENYDGNRPYLYVYRRFDTPTPPDKARSALEQALASASPPLRGVRIKTFAETRSPTGTLVTCRIGTPRHTFYKIEWIVATQEPPPEPVGEERPEPARQPETSPPERAERTEKPHTTQPTPPPPPILPTRKTRGRIAIIIDDLGSEPEHLTRRFLAFPERLTFAAFPRSATARRRAEEARRTGRFDVIIHQPMEAEGHRERGIPFMPGTVLVDMTDEEITATLEENLRSLPFCRGLNNHQGSLATTDPRVMETVMRWVRSRGLFFIDSFTSPDSVAYRKAAQHGIPWLRRDVFLDNEDDERYVQLQLNRLIQTALKNGSAVGIGHATREATISVLEANRQRIRDLGLEFVHAKDLLRRSPH